MDLRGIFGGMYGVARPIRQSIRFWWRSDNPFPYFALFSPHRSALAFARWQHHNATAIQQRFKWLPTQLIGLSVEDISN